MEMPTDEQRSFMVVFALLGWLLLYRRIGLGACAWSDDVLDSRSLSRRARVCPTQYVHIRDGSVQLMHLSV